MVKSNEICVQILHDPIFYSTYIVVRQGREYILIDLVENRAKIFDNEIECRRYIAKKTLRLAISVEDGLKELEKLVERNIEVEDIDIE